MELRSESRFASLALPRAELSEASTMEESNPIMAITTRSSMRVKPRVGSDPDFGMYRMLSQGVCCIDRFFNYGSRFLLGITSGTLKKEYSEDNRKCHQSQEHILRLLLVHHIAAGVLDSPPNDCWYLL